MYIPKHFEVTDIAIMHDLIRAHPLGTIITYTDNVLNANHIPLYLIDAQPCGILHGHIARANPLLDHLNPDLEVLVVFNGPNAYISPSWYASKQESGKVVPTWNYVAVHAYGKLKVIDDVDWLLTQLHHLTEHNEKHFAEPWAVSDAPKDFTDKLLANIIGIEITVTKLIGKWKVSQNQPQQNRNSVVAGLNTTHAVEACKMAEYVENFI